MRQARVRVGFVLALGSAWGFDSDSDSCSDPGSVSCSDPGTGSDSGTGSASEASCCLTASTATGPVIERSRRAARARSETLRLSSLIIDSSVSRADSRIPGLLLARSRDSSATAPTRASA